MRRVAPCLAALLASLGACDGGGGLGQAPVALLQAPSYCDLGSAMTLDGSQSSDADGDIILYRFVIADGSESREVVGPRTSHVCRVEGLIGVALYVEDAKGNVGQTDATIAVRPP